jgi:hypothetical protein
MFLSKDVAILISLGLLSMQATAFAPGAPKPCFVARRSSASGLHVFSNSKVATETEEDVRKKSEDTPFFAQFVDASLREIPTTIEENADEKIENSSFSYVEFAKTYPFATNIMIATTKTAFADLLAQTVMAGAPITDIDLQRSLLFCLFGATYLGAFQYLYQVQVRSKTSIQLFRFALGKNGVAYVLLFQIFKKMFDVDTFTSQSWSEKLKDVPGLAALGAQTGLDLTVLTLIYLPTFYIFKASVFGGSMDPSVWFSSGIDTFQTNFSKDEVDLIKVWLPADLVCFSVPLYLRLPVRHIVSFVWTAYLSFARGGH